MSNGRPAQFWIAAVMFWCIAPTILLGMAILVVSMFLQLLVTSTWHLVLPGIAAGVAPATLFLSVPAGVGISSRVRPRGLAVTVPRALLDFGIVARLAFVRRHPSFSHRA